ncbi:MAG: hypothetical protein EKK40_14730 [Bradyrhizobiaceae bacterium]|nr:MAG: hypothetical protein EKK40_14730 [Bradyrhizobiaceae bacterium]
MNAIEPNWVSLLWFALFAAVCGVAFLVVAGMFPLKSRPDIAQSKGAVLLLIGNALLLAALLIGTALYGYNELRWSTLIVVTGLIVLFAPTLIEEWRWPLGNVKAEMLVLIAVQAAALGLLVKIGGTSLSMT